MRKKLIGEEVYFVSERPPNANRDYGTIYLGPDAATAPNVTELLVQEGLVQLRKENSRTPTPELQRLLDLEEAAKSAGKGKWGSAPSSDYVRNIKWSHENPRSFVDQLAGNPVDAIIEHVRDGSTVRAFLLPDFQYITLMISGIRVSRRQYYSILIVQDKSVMNREVKCHFSLNYFYLVPWIQIRFGG